MKLIFLFFVIFNTLLIQGQNLVPNSSFEEYTVCPTTDGQIPEPWHSINNWGTPTYYNICNNGWYGVPVNCMGHQQAHTGRAYVGVYTWRLDGVNVREYIQAELQDSLLPDITYNVHFYVSLSDSMKYASNNFGAYISKLPITCPGQCFLPYIPQIKDSNIIINKIGWTELSGNYTALGGEKYITLGNFSPDSLTDTVYVGNNNGNNAYWIAYYYIDDVYVGFDTMTELQKNDYNKIDFSFYPNPANDKIEINVNEISDFEILNLQGQVIIKMILLNMQTTIDISNLEYGVYILRIKTENKIITKKLIRH